MLAVYIYGEVQIRNMVSAYSYYYVNQDALLLFLSLGGLGLLFAGGREGCCLFHIAPVFIWISVMCMLILDSHMMVQYVFENKFYLNN